MGEAERAVVQQQQQQALQQKAQPQKLPEPSEPIDQGNGLIIPQLDSVLSSEDPYNKPPRPLVPPHEEQAQAIA